MPAFKKAYKKLHSQEKKRVNQAILEMVKDPKIGEVKKGDLSNVYVYKFKINGREMLLAYEWTTKERLLLALGAHENFYMKAAIPARQRSKVIAHLIKKRERSLYECAAAVEKDSALHNEMKDWDITLQDGLDNESW